MVRMRCSRGTPFSALSWRRAPTKSRLMRSTSQARVRPTPAVPADRKNNVGVTHVMERRGRSCPEYTPRGPRLPAARRAPARCGEAPRWRVHAPRSDAAPGAARLRGGRGRAGLRFDATRGRVAALDVLIQAPDEAGHDVVAAVGRVELPVHKDGGDGFLERAGEADPDVGVLALAGPVHHAAHDRNPELLDARMELPPR